MSNKQREQIVSLINLTIVPALNEDFNYKNEKEKNEVESYLIKILRIKFDK